MDLNAFAGRIEKSSDRNPESDRNRSAGNVEDKKSQSGLDYVVWGENKEYDSENSQKTSENGSHWSCFSIVAERAHKGERKNKKDYACSKGKYTRNKSSSAIKDRQKSKRSAGTAVRKRILT